MITHYDLFAGIGGFSLALEEVFYDTAIRHIFCEWEQFPTAVLKKHWPEGEYWGDIADLIAHTTNHNWRSGQQLQKNKTQRSQGDKQLAGSNTVIVTGGFPCQPFSAAGRRRGTADNRYQWPNMLKVIRGVKPQWVVAENVRGLVTWNQGMVLEQVCSDLEAEGYEVQPFIIPAVAVNAPHRRDRVWIIAHNPSPGTREHKSGVRGLLKRPDKRQRGKGHTPAITNSGSEKLGGVSQQPREEVAKDRPGGYPAWQQDWREVAFATCHVGVDDGLSRKVDGVPYSRARWRKESLKAYGNAIVPQVAVEIMRALRVEQSGLI